jgi:hypothetical protein
MSQRRPGNLFDLTLQGYTEETSIQVVDPEIPRGVFCDRMDVPAGDSAHGDQPVILEVAHATECRDPDSPVAIPEERIRALPLEHSIPLALAGGRYRHPPVL